MKHLLIVLFVIVISVNYNIIIDYFQNYVGIKELFTKYTCVEEDKYDQFNDRIIKKMIVSGIDGIY